MTRLVYNGPDGERCEAKTRDSYGRATDNRCPRHASIALSGRQLGGKHASMLALEILLEGGQARQLPQVIPLRGKVRLVEQEAE